MNFITRLHIAYADARERKKLYRLYRMMKSVGRNVHICPGYSFESTENITIGDHVWIGKHMMAKAQGGLTIGSGTIIAQNCEIWTSNHNYDSDDLETIPYDKRFFLKPVFIGENVWIGSRVIILPGVTIGEGAVIGAGSVVSRDVSAFAVCAGNPIRVFKYRNIEKYKELKEKNKIYLAVEYDYDRSSLRKTEY
ncbi:MAG: acyltransferase [Clostridia bacterium]|nr:acyltransferase [Clostridia bacterium]